jgi:hypothetical protein
MRKRSLLLAKSELRNLSYDNDFTSMLFLIQSSNNPQKLIRGSITKKE